MHFLWLLAGVAPAPWLCEMGALGEQQESPAAAPGEPAPARLLSIAPAYRLSQDLGLDVKGGPRSSHRIREALYHVTELEAGQLKGASELEEADCGGRRKGQRGRATAGKSVGGGLLEREGRVYTKVVQSVSAEDLMHHIQAHTRKGSVYFPDAFRG